MRVSDFVLFSFLFIFLACPRQTAHAAEIYGSLVATRDIVIKANTRVTSDLEDLVGDIALEESRYTKGGWTRLGKIGGDALRPNVHLSLRTKETAREQADCELEHNESPIDRKIDQGAEFKIISDLTRIPEPTTAEGLRARYEIALNLNLTTFRELLTAEEVKQTEKRLSTLPLEFKTIQDLKKHVLDSEGGSEDVLSGVMHHVWPENAYEFKIQSEKTNRVYTIMCQIYAKHPAHITLPFLLDGFDRTLALKQKDI